MKKEIFPSSSCFDPVRTNSIGSNSIGTERNIQNERKNSLGEKKKKEGCGENATATARDMYARNAV